MSTTNKVRNDEAPALIIEDGDNTYLLFPDYGVEDQTVAKWGIKRINSTSGTAIQWAEGSMDKRFKASERASLTYKNLV